MKRSILILVIATLAFAGSALAQAPERGGGGQGRGGGGGRGGGRGPAAQPPLTGPLADAVNGIINAINNQDSAYLQKAVATDAVWLDEDGHMFPANIWIGRLLMATPARKVAITNLTGQMWDTAGWAAFRYTLDETAQGSPNEMKGTNSLTFKKVGNDWQVALIHAPVDGKAITPH